MNEEKTDYFETHIKFILLVRIYSTNLGATMTQHEKGRVCHVERTDVKHEIHDTPTRPTSVKPGSREKKLRHHLKKTSTSETKSH